MWTKVILAVALLGLARASKAKPTIPSSFRDTVYRVERQFLPADDARSLLHDLLMDGVPSGTNETFPPESLRAVGDGGKRNAPQPNVEDYAAAMQRFLIGDHQDSSSLVYYLEQLDGEPLYRSEEMISEVISNSVLEDGGTVHLYLSSPGVAALGNHTDTTDIVVVQLDGAKEWLLCTNTQKAKVTSSMQDLDVFSKKLDSCSSYSELEISSLDCHRTVLEPGDALFLPRRIVHSARARPDQSSAHLTFGFNEDDFCWAYGSKKRKSQAVTSSNRFLYNNGYYSYSSYRPQGGGFQRPGPQFSGQQRPGPQFSGQQRPGPQFQPFPGRPHPPIQAEYEYYPEYYPDPTSYHPGTQCPTHCDLSGCTTSCDGSCNDGCDSDCNSHCDEFLLFSCDRKCDQDCDRDCDQDCDSTCECNCD